MSAQNELDEAARKIRAVVDGLIAIFRGANNATVNNGTENLPTIAKLLADGQAQIVAEIGNFTTAADAVVAKAALVAAHLATVQDLVEQAEEAADAAADAGNTYPDTATGLAAVAEGDYFTTPSGLTDEDLIRYRKVGGVAVEQKRTPEATLVRNLKVSVTQMLETVRDTLPGEVLDDGSPLPPAALVNPETGEHRLWVDQYGLTRLLGDDNNMPYRLVALTGDLADRFSLRDSFRVDEQGAFLAGKLIDGHDERVVMVECTGTIINVYVRVGPKTKDFYAHWRWERTTGTTEDLWRWQDTRQVTREGHWWFINPITWIGGGVQDIVSNEASNGDGSIDFPGQAVDNFMGPGHGNEFMTRDLLMWIDGIEIDPKKPARFFCHHLRMAHQSKIFRSRNPHVNYAESTPLAIIDKTWTITAAEQLRWDHRVTPQQQWTGYIYFPLITVKRLDGATLITNRLLRDDAFRHLVLPDDIDHAGGTENAIREGVRELVFAGPLGGLEIRVSEAARYAAGGFRKPSARLPLGVDYQRMKVPPLDDDHKTYHHVGGDPVVVGPETFNRFAAGEVIERQGSVKLFLN